jgi:hypothetical protein
MTQIRPTLGTVTLDGKDYDTVRVGLIHATGTLRSMLNGDQPLEPNAVQRVLEQLAHVQALLEDPIFRGPLDRP